MQVKTVHQGVQGSSEKTLSDVTSTKDAKNFHCSIFECKVTFSCKVKPHSSEPMWKGMYNSYETKYSCKKIT